PGELSDAKRVARTLGIKHLIVKFNELELPGFAENPPNRCYLCKKARFKLLRRIAEERGFSTVADGTNMDDVGEYRPGLQALKEEEVYSPLLENQLGKKDSRMLARFLRLPVMDKPADTCLATRFPYYHRMDLAGLRRVRLAEAYLKRRWGLKLVRVRNHGDLARIEIESRELPSVLREESLREAAGRLRRLGFRYVTLDLSGYRRGVFDENLKGRRLEGGRGKPHA
ncbi:MAG: ATP-dependent sacrificial sulfur transferase LarE, partial [Candidatus Hecatellales archaeon]